jgi:hypothetical protein
MYIESIFSLPPQLQISTMASGTDSEILGPVLSPNATYQERMAYRREVLKLPGPIDRWLTANSRSPWISFLRDYLMIDDMQKDYVICFVEAVYVEVCLLSYRPEHFSTLWQGAVNSAGFKQPDTHSLFVTARAAPGAENSMLLYISPRALLERFVGSSQALDAPAWTAWTQPSLEFEQLRATFTELFVRMADWEINKIQVRSLSDMNSKYILNLSCQPGLSYSMIQWARSVMVTLNYVSIHFLFDFVTQIRYEAPAHIFQPVTPRNIGPVQHTSMHVHKTRKRSLSDDETPSKVQSRKRIKVA